MSGAAHSREPFTEDYLLGAVSGAARGCELLTEDYRLEAVSGAAGSCGRKTGSIKELRLLRAVFFELRGRRNHFRYENPGKRATSFSPFLLLPALVAVGRFAHCSQLVFFSKKSPQPRAAPLTAPSWSSSVKRLTAPSCSAPRSQPVVFSKKARSRQLLCSELPAFTLSCRRPSPTP